MRRRRDLERVCLAAVACALVAGLVPWEAVRLVAALPLAVFLPGYAIAAAAFAPYRLDPYRLTMVILAGGLSVLCLGGLVLDPLPGGLRTLSWVLLLVLVVLAAALVAARRRRRPTKRGASRARAAGREQQRPRRARLRLRPLDAACAGLALAALVGALVLAYTPLPATDAAGYTALWVLPGRSEAAPSVRVGVESSEQQGGHFQLRVRSAKGKSRSSYRFALKPGAKRVFNVPVKVDANGPTRVAASLYERSRPGELYRRVTTWLRSGAATR